MATNRQSWSQNFAIEDAETGEAIDLAGVQIVFEVRHAGAHAPALAAAIVNVAAGVFNAQLSRDQMRTLAAGTYDVGCTITRDGETEQLIDGTWPIIDGVVR